jgi:hypothetical protein
MAVTVAVPGLHSISQTAVFFGFDARSIPRVRKLRLLGRGSPTILSYGDPLAHVARMSGSESITGRQPRGSITSTPIELTSLGLTRGLPEMACSSSRSRGGPWQGAVACRGCEGARRGGAIVLPLAHWRLARAPGSRARHWVGHSLTCEILGYEISGQSRWSRMSARARSLQRRLRLQSVRRVSPARSKSATENDSGALRDR